ncbi:hypothetical protein Moror_10588 [Moniliophthora roreri MCA 2997]|uniref:Uncharacterized protein n=2 Tax=Moniliophthora roreri TaxID=221103 RepID=V2YJ86_MONRO|nr:hypothetical protein Moror_10588 [Moniliophthora roreri MCA 2997]
MEATVNMDRSSIKRFPLPKSISSSRSLSMQRLFRCTVSLKERQTIMQWLLDAERDVKTQQAEINRLKAAITTLENKQKGLVKSMERYRSLLAPVHRMPPEILSNIFQYFCEESEIPHSSPAPPVLLSAICGRWREIVLTTPCLWSTVTIRFSKWERDHEALASKVELFMERSQLSLLSLELDFSDVEQGIQPFLPAIQNLVEHSIRWRRVTFRVVPSMISHSVLAPIHGRLPRLEHVHLSSASWRVHQADNSPWDAELRLFETCPALRSFEFEPDLRIRHVLAPYDQITFLKLCDAYSSTAFKFLSSLPNVERLELFRIGGESLASSGTFTGHIVSSNLKHLSITAEEQHDVSSALEFTTLPELLSLDIRSVEEEETDESSWYMWDEVPFKSFLTRSSCNITSLSLRCVPISDEQLVNTLLLMPRLSSLCLQEYRNTQSGYYLLTDEFLTRLAVDHGSSSSLFLPHLTDLTLHARADRVDFDHLTKALTSRWVPDSDYSATLGCECLQSVTITLMDNKDHTESLRHLQSFRDAGMRVSISYFHLDI